MLLVLVLQFPAQLVLVLPLPAQLVLVLPTQAQLETVLLAQEEVMPQAVSPQPTQERRGPAPRLLTQLQAVLQNHLRVRRALSPQALELW